MKTFESIDVTATKYRGRNVLFATSTAKDPIQRAHKKGFFYEFEELAIIERHFVPGSTFVDIGANVGNHSLYCGLFLGASKIIPIEPNPLVVRLLEANMTMNNLMPITDLSWVGYGMSDRSATGYGMQDRARNLGASKMLEGEGDLSTITGDEALRDEDVAFIKIDVEGMEMMVLSGLENKIRECRPTIFIEVNDDNAEDFHTWCEKNEYKAASRFRRYRTNENFLIVPAQPKRG